MTALGVPVETYWSKLTVLHHVMPALTRTCSGYLAIHVAPPHGAETDARNTPGLDPGAAHDDIWEGLKLYRAAPPSRLMAWPVTCGARTR